MYPPCLCSWAFPLRIAITRLNSCGLYSRAGTIRSAVFIRLYIRKWLFQEKGDRRQVNKGMQTIISVVLHAYMLFVIKTVEWWSSRMMETLLTWQSHSFCYVRRSRSTRHFIFPAAAQVELGFKETDRGVTEGDNEDFNLRRYTGTLTSDVVLRVIPLTVSGFENYRNNNPTRIFADSILNDVAEIFDPAECEHYTYNVLRRTTLELALIPSLLHERGRRKSV